MSTINVTNLSGRGGATPNLPDGANITGVATATSFDGSLKSTGTPTLGLGVTINASGVAISGVCTAGIVSATTFYGSGSGLTGVGESIAPWHYNPDIGDTGVMLDELSSSGIGITFNKKVLQGSSGTATLKIVNAGVAGTTIQSWGVSSTSYDITVFTLDANVSDITLDQTYQIDIPEGFIVDSAGTSYAGTAYTFTATGPVGKLFAWGNAGNGKLGINGPVNVSKSSPTQIPGNGWSQCCEGGNRVNEYSSAGMKDDGSLWVWGYNYKGDLGQNGAISHDDRVSSPVQVPGTWKSASKAYGIVVASKTDGTLWSWGYNYQGQLGHNQGNTSNYSSPTQIGSGTDWNGAQYTFKSGRGFTGAIKTNGTLWSWGFNENGQLGHNNKTVYSSPVQIPGTTWSLLTLGNISSGAIKTDGTLWMWGKGSKGCLGTNLPEASHRSSPVQVPGTTWRSVNLANEVSAGTKTDGTLWTWGVNNYGQLAQNNTTNYSSPVQVPGTTWNKVTGTATGVVATKTDGTMWGWGYGDSGNSVGGAPGIGEHMRSSPVQIPGTEWKSDIGSSDGQSYAIQLDETP